MNVIWQGDANEIAIRSLLLCQSPPKILNVSGPETISIRWVAGEFGKMFGKEPQLLNMEEPTSLLSNASQCHRLFGYPRVSLREMMEMIAEWVINDGEISDKLTHFQERTGHY